MTEAGHGSNLFATREVNGTARWFLNPADVLSVDAADLPGTIAFVRKGGTTFLAPILPDLGAVVCTAGSTESHLAILARDYGIPCVMGAELSADIEDGDDITLHLADERLAGISVQK